MSFESEDSPLFPKFNEFNQDSFYSFGNKSFCDFNQANDFLCDRFNENGNEYVITSSSRNDNYVESNKKTGLLAITLKDEDELIDVRLTNGEDNIVMVTENGMCITFDEKDVRPVGRSAQGVIGIRIDDDDKVIGMESILENKNATNIDMLYWTNF